MKNDDNECFLYCYIRKFKNIVNNNASRISKKDLLIVEEIIDECYMDFKNVSLDELDKIENLLKVHIKFTSLDVIKNLLVKKLLEKVNLILIKI